MADARTYALLKEAGSAAALAKASFNLFANFTKAEEQDDGSIIVSGLASSETKDSDGEVILASAIKAAIPEYMQWANVREMHSNIAAGKALSIHVNDAGETEFEARIINSETVKKVKEGVLQGFSIGGRKVKYDPSDRHIITGISLSEVSVVDRPANPDCRFQIAKFDGAAEKSMYTVGSLASMLQEIGWMCQSLQAEAEMEGDQSTMPAKLREWLSMGVEVFGELTEEETQELLVSSAGPEGMPLRGAESKAAKALKAHLLKRWESHPHGPVAVSLEADMADDLKKAAKDDVSKAWKDVEATHKAHKDASDAVKSLKDDASKDDTSKAMKDLDEAHKSHKDACDAHKDACGKAVKAIMGSVKDDSSKDDAGKSAELGDLRKAVSDQGAALAEMKGLLEKALAQPAASPLELLLAKAREKEGLLPGDDLTQELDPKDPLFDMKKAMRTPLSA